MKPAHVLLWSPALRWDSALPVLRSGNVPLVGPVQSSDRAWRWTVIRALLAKNALR
jgi:hypothetical protein